MSFRKERDYIDFLQLTENLLGENKLPSLEQIKECMGDRLFSEYQSIDDAKLFTKKSVFLIGLGLRIEQDNTDKRIWDKEYKDIFYYALGAHLKKPQDPKDYSSLIRNIKIKYTLGAYDSRLETLLTLCQKKEKQLKLSSSAVTSSDEINLITNSKNLKSMLSQIKQSNNKTLSDILKIVYKIYLRSNELLEKINKNSTSISDENIDLILVKQDSLRFMKTVLDTSDEKIIQTQMESILKKRKDLDKEYIPGMEFVLTGKMKMKKKYKSQDTDNKIIYLEPEKRDEYRVVIKEGKFVERQINNLFKNTDTSVRLSHGKPSFAAFVINLSGEISLFDHLDSDDRMAHSSMSAGKPVYAAGELKIIDGKLIAITNYSGHYKPKEHDVYLLLKFLIDKKVDLSTVEIGLQKETSELKKIDKLTDTQPWYKAIDLLELWEKRYQPIARWDTFDDDKSLNVELASQAGLDWDAFDDNPTSSVKPELQEDLFGTNSTFKGESDWDCLEISSEQNAKEDPFAPSPPPIDSTKPKNKEDSFDEESSPAHPGKTSPKK